MKQRKTPTRIPSAKSKDQPVSRAMFLAFKEEIRSELRLNAAQTHQQLTQLREEFKRDHAAQDTRIGKVEYDIKQILSDVEQLKKDVAQLKIDVAQLKTDVTQLKIDVAQLKTEFAEMKLMMHRISVLVEEQNSNNRIVLEGLQALWQRQDRLEKKVNAMKRCKCQKAI
jgi:chromosome segregation ATPase